MDLVEIFKGYWKGYTTRGKYRFGTIQSVSLQFVKSSTWLQKRFGSERNSKEISALGSLMKWFRKVASLLSLNKVYFGMIMGMYEYLTFTKTK